MKTLYKGWLLAAISIVLSSCSSPTSNAPLAVGENTGTAKSAVAYDGTNSKIGYCQPSGTGISVVSSIGYYYDLRWDGTIFPTTGYFTGADATGTLTQELTSVTIAKRVFRINDQLYTFRDSDANGNALPDATITGHMSYIDSQNTVYNSSSTFPSYVSAYALKTITRSEAGIPTTIVLPITIKYE